ncbi:hypothetical protein CEXT_792911 [Caerostris extrusa]|uniref:Uncharacterized protein n=1 Tax=Caerostris extrusa TaxID=172846 RepID=A0AAV4T2E5_CAEEX|nr:hypothetical protein CEXT_792911 [Caerostris extrusa]
MRRSASFTVPVHSAKQKRAREISMTRSIRCFLGAIYYYECSLSRCSFQYSFFFLPLFGDSPGTRGREIVPQNRTRRFESIANTFRSRKQSGTM